MSFFPFKGAFAKAFLAILFDTLSAVKLG